MIAEAMEPLAVGPKTAFVFAGGGSFGAVQVGMLRSLVGRGLNADRVVGSSVGAMNSAYYAGTPTAEGVEALARIWRGLRRRDVFPLTWRDWLRFVRRRDFLVGSEGLHRLVHTHLPYCNLQDAKIPVHIIATDLVSGEAVIISEGPAAQAIIASTAIPAAFAPVQNRSPLPRRWRYRELHTGSSGRRARREAPDRSTDGLCLCAPSSTARCGRKRATCAHVANHAASDRRTRTPRRRDRISCRAAAMSAAGITIRFFVHKRAHRARHGEHRCLARRRWPRAAGDS
jgi:Patatin-like phospholipase